jgi:hypothetical protein
LAVPYVVENTKKDNGWDYKRWDTSHGFLTYVLIVFVGVAVLKLGVSWYVSIRPTWFIVIYLGEYVSCNAPLIVFLYRKFCKMVWQALSEGTLEIILQCMKWSNINSNSILYIIIHTKKQICQLTKILERHDDDDDISSTSNHNGISGLFPAQSKCLFFIYWPNLCFTSSSTLFFS